MRSIDDAAMLKLSWNSISSSGQWASLIRARFMKHKILVSYYTKSSIWHALRTHLSTVLHNSTWLIGDGYVIDFWHDKWLFKPLVDTLNIPPNISKQLSVELKTLLSMDLGLFLLICKISFLLLLLKLAVLCYPLKWGKVIWSNCIPLSSSFVFWRLIHNRMPTDANLMRRGCYIASRCNLCGDSIETSFHSFFQCRFALKIWTWLNSTFQCSVDLSTTSSILSVLERNWSSQVKDILLAAVTNSI